MEKREIIAERMSLPTIKKLEGGNCARVLPHGENERSPADNTTIHLHVCVFDVIRCYYEHNYQCATNNQLLNNF